MAINFIKNINMKRVIRILSVIVLFLSSCNDDYIDTGLAVSKHDISMYDYFKTDPYNWDSTRLIIDRAELKPYFDGSNSEYSNITFFGPTNFSIVRWMKNNNFKSVSAIPTAKCDSLIKMYIVKKLYMKDDFAFEVKGTELGGTKITKIDNQDIRVFRRKTNYGTIADAGPVEMHLQTYAASQYVMIASSNILTNTGVVHSLSYTYTFGNF